MHIRHFYIDFFWHNKVNTFSDMLKFLLKSDSFTMSPILLHSNEQLINKPQRSNSFFFNSFTSQTMSSWIDSTCTMPCICNSYVPLFLPQNLKSRFTQNFPNHSASNFLTVTSIIIIINYHIVLVTRLLTYFQLPITEHFL